MYVNKTASGFTSARKYKLTKLLTFIWVLTFKSNYLGATQNRRQQFFADVLFFNIRR